MSDLSIFKLDTQTINIKDTTAREAADSAKTLATTASGNATTALNKINELESEKADAIISSASGAIASFQDGAEAPVKSLTVGIEPVQEGTGDPSPDNVRPISGWTGAKVTRTGKNLLNLVESEMIEVGWNRAFPFSIKEGTYILSCQNQYGVGSALGSLVTLTDENNVTIKILANSFNFGNTIYSGNPTVVTKEEASRIKRIVFKLRAENTTYADIFRGNLQLELGSTATDYEPCQGSTYPITFPTEAGTVYGGTLDVTNGVLTVDRAMVDLSSYNIPWLTWGVNHSKSGVTGFYFYRADIPSILDFSNIREAVLTNLLAINDGAWGGSAVGYNTNARGELSDWYEIVSISNETANILSTDTNAEAIEKFKAFLESTPLNVLYELAEPIHYPLTAIDIKTLLGTNNIWADTGDMSVTYRADTKLYIDKKFTELQALILEN